MYNSEHQGRCPPISPRISFSNEFAEAQFYKQERASRPEAPASTDFEFSVSNYSMLSADELFFKGKLLPFIENGANSGVEHRTIRDELSVDYEDEEDKLPHKPPKSFSRLKGLLGLRKGHSASKKVEKIINEEVHGSKEE